MIAPFHVLPASGSLLLSIDTVQYLIQTGSLKIMNK